MERGFNAGQTGGAENAGVEISARCCRGWKMQEWNLREGMCLKDLNSCGFTTLSYVERQWITKSTVGPQRLSVRDNPSRTNNVLESFHSALRSRVKVAHPNVFAFLAHLQRATVDSQAVVRRASRGMAIRRAKKKTNVVNDKRIKTCLQRYDTHAYTRLQNCNSCKLLATATRRTPTTSHVWRGRQQQLVRRRRI